MVPCQEDRRLTIGTIRSCATSGSAFASGLPVTGDDWGPADNLIPCCSFIRLDVGTRCVQFQSTGGAIEHRLQLVRLGCLAIKAFGLRELGFGCGKGRSEYWPALASARAPPSIFRRADDRLGDLELGTVMFSRVRHPDAVVDCAKPRIGAACRFSDSGGCSTSSRRSRKDYSHNLGFASVGGSPRSVSVVVIARVGRQHLRSLTVPHWARR